MTKGQFSLINLFEVLLEQAGPAHVSISTWTSGSAEIKEAYRLLRNGAILSLRFLIDLSFITRKRDYCIALRDYFGDSCIRATKNHAKFILIRNKKWNLAVRTSMDLNENPRNENFEISDDKGLADFIEEFLNDVWASQKDGDVLGKRPAWHYERFNKFGIDPNAELEGSPSLGVSLDDASQPGFGRP